MLLRRTWLRFIPTLVGLIAFGLLATLYVLATPLYLAILFFIGIDPWSYPFLDGQFMYAMKHCWEHGVDIYKSVPCDVVPGNKMAYSPLWPRLPFLPDDTTARVPIGLATDVLLLLSICVLPPVKTVREAALLTLATLSTMVCFALERNNIDVWMYLLIVIGVLLFIQSGAMRCLAYFVIFTAGLLKYYPLALMLLAIRELHARFLLIAALSSVGLAVFATVFWSELLQELPNIPAGSPFADLVGIANMPLASAQVAAPLIRLGPQGQAIIALSLRLALTALVLGRAIMLAGHPAFAASIDRVARTDTVWLVTGCLTMGACYLLGQNVGYRGIYLLIVLSGLLALCRACEAGRLRSYLVISTIIVVPIMWMEGARGWVALLLKDSPLPVKAVSACLLWITRELLWLNLECVLLAVVIAYAMQSATGNAVRSRLGWLVSARRIVNN